MFDMVEELAAIHREVVRDEDAQTVSVALTRAYEADTDDVWDALTNPNACGVGSTWSLATSRSGARSKPRTMPAAKFAVASGPPRCR